MPYGVIVLQTLNYEPRLPGTYALSTLNFGDPTNEVRVNGAKKGKDGNYRGSVTRVLHKVTGTGADEVLHSMVMSLSLSADTEFTATEMDSAATDISEFLTTDTITRLMAGES